MSSAVFILGSLILAGAGNYLSLLVGRLVVGLGVGIASMIIPVYVSKYRIHPIQVLYIVQCTHGHRTTGELAPKNIRGRLSTLNTLVVTFGQVVAYLVNIAFATTPHGWRHMFGLAVLPALCQLIGKYKGTRDRKSQRGSFFSYAMDARISSSHGGGRQI